MEQKIRLFANYLSVAAGIFCLFLIVDELLPTYDVQEVVEKRFEIKTKEGNSTFSEYYVTSNSGRKIEIPLEFYMFIQPKDKMNLFFTPMFRQLKAFDCTSIETWEVTSHGDPAVPREIPLYSSIAAVMFAFLSFYVAKRFELKVTFAFFSLIITAVRWWFIGV